MDVKDDNNSIRATGKIMARSTLHGRSIPPGCLVEVDTIDDTCNFEMKPPGPGPFDGDEPIQIGEFYVWSISKLSPLSK